MGEWSLSWTSILAGGRNRAYGPNGPYEPFEEEMRFDPGGANCEGRDMPAAEIGGKQSRF
jgi:hypothetical protein